MTRFLRCLAIVVAAVLLVPMAAPAQDINASVNGVVRDSSGGVLPGVTVEVASPALIEKVRSTVTDDQGRYQIVSVRPGLYSLTFTLPGFSTVKHENITLAGGITSKIDADMRVGAQEETITVTGEAPLIDITQAKRQRSMSSEIMEALPSSRIHASLAQLIPGIQAASQDVGGTIVSAGTLSGHGTKGGDSRIMINGLSQGSTRNSGGGRTTPNVGAMQETTIDYTGADASAPTGGISVNLVPKEGGNQLKSSSYISYASSNWQSNNLSQSLMDRGLEVRDRLKDNWDMNPGFGGPIKTDKLWFFVSFRNITANNYVGGMFVNKNAGDPSKWTYEANHEKQAVENKNWKDLQSRFTWQISPRNKMAITINELRDCECYSPTGTVSPEAAAGATNSVLHQFYLDYTIPLTNKILVEFNGFWRGDNWNTGNYGGNTGPHEIGQDVIDANTAIFPGGTGVDVRYLSRAPYLNPISVTTTGLAYRNQSSFSDSHHIGFFYRASMSYVTGSHNIKVGFNNDPAWLTGGTNAVDPLGYRFSRPLEEAGVANQITMRATPYFPYIDTKRNMGIYAQDRWTTHRLTIGYGLRYDAYVGSYREQHFGPVPLNPTRNITFAAGESNNWKDITPRTSVSWDVFGTGKTAIKGSYSKYMGAAATNGLNGQINPYRRLSVSATRSWTDSNGNFIVDCDILGATGSQNFTATGGDRCGAISDAAFLVGDKGGIGLSVNPDLQKGWNARDYNWEASLGVQHELRPGLVLDVAYFRRWYGNQTVVDNLAVTADDYDQYTIIAPSTTPFAETAPPGTTLPTAGQPVGPLYNIKENKFSTPADNYWTFAKDFGNQTERWQGVDMIAVARLPGGLRLQAGTSTGKTLTDTCEIRAKLPESATTNPYCRVDTGFLTDFTGFVTYTIPKWDILTSMTFQNRPARSNPIAANYTASSAEAGRPISEGGLGRPLSGGSSNVTVNVVAPYQVQPDRLSQVDFRFGKVIRAGITRTTLNFDLYNAFNSNSVLVQNSSFDVWQEPDEILLGRFLKLGVQFDF